MKPILIATTNPGKFKEFQAEFNDLPYRFVSLKDVKLDHIDLDEPYDTTEQNAIHKAKFFARKSKLLTIAEDTGFFVDALRGAPGVKAKRFAPTVEERNQKVLDGLKNVAPEKRTARFVTSACVYNPATESYSIFTGKVDGLIAKKMGTPPAEGMTYDSIFYYPPLKKLFADISISEKNLISHRGKIMNQIRFHLEKLFGFKQIVVPVAFLVKDRKLLLLSRRDSRPDFNKKWEFPGGGVERGESVEHCIIRECKEETGFTVTIKERLPQILTHYESRWNYQVFLIGFICSVKSGNLKLNKSESHGSRWYTYKELLSEKNSLPLNKKLIQDNKELLKKYID